MSEYQHLHRISDRLARRLPTRPPRSRYEHHDDLCETYWEDDAKAWTECSCAERLAIAEGR